jgi:hypothetical protein
MYGLVNINGQNYVERSQDFPLEVTVSTNLGITTGSLVLPGVANFWLKALTRDVIVAGASSARRFRFRLFNSDGSTWYSAAGVGGTTNRVIDSCYFGNGQFPRVLIPHIFFSSSASIGWEVEDVSNNQPYTIFISFVGSYLIPTS